MLAGIHNGADCAAVIAAFAASCIKIHEGAAWRPGTRLVPDPMSGFNVETASEFLGLFVVLRTPRQRKKILFWAFHRILVQPKKSKQFNKHWLDFVNKNITV